MHVIPFLIHKRTNMATKKTAAKKAAKKVSAPPPKKCAGLENGKPGKDCKGKPRTSRSLRCQPCQKEVRRDQLARNNVTWQKRVAKGTAGHHLKYRGKPTVAAITVKKAGLKPEEVLKQGEAPPKKVAKVLEGTAKVTTKKAPVAVAASRGGGKTEATRKAVAKAVKSGKTVGVVSKDGAKVIKAKKPAPKADKTTAADKALAKAVHKVVDEAVKEKIAKVSKPAKKKGPANHVTGTQEFMPGLAPQVVESVPAQA